MRGNVSDLDELTANIPATCVACGEKGVDTSAHHSRYWGICVNCGTAVNID